MLKGAVAGRYAEALYDIGVRENNIDQLEEELLAVYQVLKESEPFRKIINHPRITADEKKEVLANLFKGRISVIMLSFLGYVLDRQREFYLPDMTERFTGLANKARNICDIQVTSAVELTSEEKENLGNAMAKSTGKKVRLDFNVDQELLGGVIVRVGDKIIDGSVRYRLQALHEHLRQIS